MSLDDQILALPEPSRRRFACACAEYVLSYYAAVYPRDRRPYQAIATAREFASGQATSWQLVDALEQVTLARDMAKTAALEIERTSWDTWRNHHLQGPPPPNLHETDFVLRDSAGQPGRDLLMQAAGRAAAWLFAGVNVRQRWAMLHAAWSAVEAAYWAAWLDTDYAPEVLEIVGAAGLANARYACKAADWAARCTVEAAAMRVLAAEREQFLPYYGNVPQYGPPGRSLLAARYSDQMESARRTAMAEQQVWQLRVLETYHAQAATPQQPCCSAEICQALTRRLSAPPLGKSSQDALRALQALDCALDPLALLAVLNANFHQHIKTLPFRAALEATIKAHIADSGWCTRYRAPLSDALLAAMSSIHRGHYEDCAELLCLLKDRRVLDVIRRDFPMQARLSLHQRSMDPGRIAHILGNSGFPEAPRMLEAFLPACVDDQLLLSMAAGHAEAAGGAATVDLIIEHVYPQCSRQSYVGYPRKILELLSNLRGPGIVDAWLAHLDNPSANVKQALLLALSGFYREQQARAPAYVLEAVAPLIATVSSALIWVVTAAMRDLGGKAAIPYLKAARPHVTDQICLKQVDQMIANLQQWTHD